MASASRRICAVSSRLLALGTALFLLATGGLVVLVLLAAGLRAASILFVSVLWLCLPLCVLWLALSGSGIGVPFHGVARFLVRAGYTMLRLFRSLPGTDSLAPERMLLEINNRLLVDRLSHTGRLFDPARVLVLLPHCLQSHECGIRLTFDPTACRRCGRCPMGDLITLCTESGVSFAVATGGTTARKHVREHRPELIVAVACPRDMASGILDTHPISVYGQLNEWPHGECYDTWVDVEAFGDALRSLVAMEGMGTEPERSP